MIKEEWRDIVGYEGLYAVSNCGRVKSLERLDSLGRRVNEKILSPSKDGNGYLYVNFYRNGERKMYKVHRLVLMTFNPVDNIDNLQVNHIDENKTNNHLSNLEWVTCKENCNHGTRNKRVSEANRGHIVSDDTKRKICKSNSKPIVQIDASTNKVVNVWGSAMEAERKGFNNGNINSCCKGKRKTHKGFRWMYLKDWLKEHNKGIPKKLYFID